MMFRFLLVLGWSLSISASITKSGYAFKLQYQPEQHNNQPKTRRKRNIIWYTPPYNKRVINNIGKTFLHLIDKEFTKDHPLHKLFNRNNVKISYSCMSNIKQTINMHNKNLLKPKPDIENPRLCNCRVKADCPLDEKCLTKSIIYQASVTTNNNEPTQHYIGLTDTTFKIRYNNHTSSFRNISKKHATELSKHKWHLKKQC